jgi:hypothetical protein
MYAMAESQQTSERIISMENVEAKSGKPDDNPGHGGGNDNPGQGHQITIIVNGRPEPWSKNQISYDELVTLSGLPLPGGPNPGFTITYTDGPPNKPDGTVTTGQTVKVRDGEVFNVTPTNQS